MLNDEKKDLKDLKEDAKAFAENELNLDQLDKIQGGGLDHVIKVRPDDIDGDAGSKISG